MSQEEIVNRAPQQHVVADIHKENIGSPMKRPHLDVEQSSPLQSAQRNSNGTHHEGDNDCSHSTGAESDQIEEWEGPELQKCSFPKEIAAIIIGKDQKDVVLNFMRSFRNERSNTSNVMLDTELHTNIEKFTKEYRSIMHELHQNLNEYTSTDLRHNTDTKEEYDQFVELRTHITNTYKHGQHLMKQIYKFRMNQDVDLIQVNVNFKPTMLGRDYESEFFSLISDSVKTINKQALNKLCNIMQGEIVDLQFAMKDSTNFIKAKAMRTVLLSNKFLKDDILFKHKGAAPNPKNTTKRDKQEPTREIKENHTQNRQKTNRNFQRDQYQTSQHETTDVGTDHEKRYRKNREFQPRRVQHSDNYHQRNRPYTDHTTDTEEEYDDMEHQYTEPRQKPQYKPRSVTYRRRNDNTHREERQYRRYNRSDRDDQYYQRPPRSDRYDYHNQEIRDHRQYRNKWYDRNFPPIHNTNNNSTTNRKN